MQSIFRFCASFAMRPASFDESRFFSSSYTLAEHTPQLGLLSLPIKRSTSRCVSKNRMAYSITGSERSSPVTLESALFPSGKCIRSIVGLGVPNAKSSGQNAISSAFFNLTRSVSSLLSVASYRHFCPKRHAEIATFFIG